MENHDFWYVSHTCISGKLPITVTASIIKQRRLISLREISENLASSINDIQARIQTIFPGGGGSNLKVHKYEKLLFFLHFQ